ncbi:MAG TPA: NADH-quinone oxidoreductase subunit NuoF [Gemmataceae bacterium]|jgi:NADH:ubiquinone oxidoreductase subunit F (NADH-binding)/NADH:ubiquinone oxidoreductase subunit E|nr:NADH-quinone oxidoreductase subunit NuoF [Gemmataceae bacterium]
MRAQPYRSKRNEAIVDDAVAGQGRTPGVALPVLRAVQASNQSFLDKPVLGAVADALQVNDARIYGLASFYSLFSTEPRAGKVLRICDGPVCMLQRAESIQASIKAADTGREWAVERCSCLGLCDRAPAVLRGDEPCGPVSPACAGDILKGSPCGTMPCYGQPLPGEVRVALSRIGRVDPDSIESAIEAGAYRVLDRALDGPPAAVLDAVDRSGLRGCGGAGFPTGRKWRMVAQASGPQKYVVCNADESEPGTFKDRVLLESDPHLLLEGMALAGYAVGASEGIIYLRGEYEWIARRLERALAQAEERGWLGINIRGNAFSLRIHVHRGAGAYICGEETALLESLEGRRGEPRIRPPYPTSHGYNGRPTLVNNVETLCFIPAIVLQGPDWFRSWGTTNSPGTKVFAVTGCVNRPCAFEAPLGITLRQVIERFGGGMHNGSRFKAALTGGAAGTFVPPSMLDVPIDFDSSKQGVALGSGAMLILDESVPVSNLLTWLLHFFELESCGKCTPCREGTREARLMCERIATGRGSVEDLAELKRLARLMNLASLCGLGQSVAWPVESALRHFSDELGRGNVQLAN